MYPRLDAFLNLELYGSDLCKTQENLPASIYISSSIVECAIYSSFSACSCFSSLDFACPGPLEAFSFISLRFLAHSIMRLVSAASRARAILVCNINLLLEIVVITVNLDVPYAVREDAVWPLPGDSLDKNCGCGSSNLMPEHSENRLSETHEFPQGKVVVVIYSNNNENRKDE